MITAEQALSALLEAIPDPRAETSDLEGAVGRILAEDLVAAWALPPYDNAALDGYALRSADVAHACGTTPVTLRVVDRIYAGGAPSGPVGPGEAARIMTGAPMPPGADTMVRQEATVANGDEVDVRIASPAGANIRRKGEDMAPGTVVVPAGTTIDGPVIAALCAFGKVAVPVGIRPRVAIVPTGDELVPPEQARADAVVESNAPMVAAMLREVGLAPVRHPIAPDREDALRESLASALKDADILVTTGGASVGERDYIRRTFEALGGEVLFWKVAIKPGKAVGVAKLGDKLLFGLPGNPAACAATFELLVRPAVLAWQGAKRIQRPRVPAVLDGETRKQPAFDYFMRGSARMGERGVVATMPPRQGSGQLGPTLRHNAIVELPRGRDRYQAGDAVFVRLIGPPHPEPAPPVVGFPGTSDSGKTTVLTRLIPVLVDRGLRVGAVKHDAHGFEIDHPGKDSMRLREAGAQAVALAGPDARATVVHTDHAPGLDEAIRTLPGNLDLILVEGYKHAPIPKIEIHRGDREVLAAGTIDGVVAVVTDTPERVEGLPTLGHDAIDALADLVMATAGLT